jgi:hypothetical protein
LSFFVSLSFTIKTLFFGALLRFDDFLTIDFRWQCQKYSHLPQRYTIFWIAPNLDARPNKSPRVFYVHRSNLNNERQIKDIDHNIPYAKTVFENQRR